MSGLVLLLLAPTGIVPIVAAPLWGRERELETFDALRMTPQSAWEIVTGKAYAAVRATPNIYGLFIVFICPVLLGCFTQPISTVSYVATVLVLAVTTFELVALCVNVGMGSTRSASAIAANFMLLGLLQVFPFLLSFAIIGGDATSPWFDLLAGGAVARDCVRSIVVLCFGLPHIGTPRRACELRDSYRYCLPDAAHRRAALRVALRAGRLTRALFLTSILGTAEARS